MSCAQARKILYPDPARCALSIETAQALDHLRQCGECRSYFEAQREWSRRLREKAGMEPAPEALRERVAELVKAPEPRTRWGRRRWVAAAVLVVAGGTGWWLASFLPAQFFFRELCEDHAKYLSAGSQVASEGRADIEAWFRGKTDFSVRVPNFENAEPLGGRLCFLRGRKAALVFYRKRGRPVSLFQFDERGVNLRALTRWDVDSAPLWRTSWKGYSLVAFRDRGVIYALVSDLRESELLDLAAAARESAKGS